MVDSTNYHNVETNIQDDAKNGCPECGSRNFDWWANRNGDQEILCEVCGWSKVEK